MPRTNLSDVRNLKPVAAPYRVEKRDLGNGRVGHRVVGPEISEYWAADELRANGDVLQLNAAWIAGYRASLITTAKGAAR